jgi:hypothetical protein
MKNIMLVFTLVVLFSSNASAQRLLLNHEDCSSLLAALEPAATNATEDQMENLLSSVNSFCLQSVEFSEWVNEVLYSFLTSKPEKFINAYRKQPKEIQAYIINEISNPINDGIDLKGSSAESVGIIRFR